MDNKIIDSVLIDLDNRQIGDDDRKVVIEQINELKNRKLNIMLVGATGVGKSSTINAIFDMEIAKVGYSVNPETSTIQKYELDNIILWDTPGLGDSPEKDKNYAIQIANALKEKDRNGDLVIDEVVVLIDGSNRDMKTTYEVIEKVIVPYIGDTSRIVIAINQCDMAMKGRYWDRENKQPKEQLVTFLNEKVVSIRSRILESTGVLTTPIYYSATNHYNISKLLLTMMKSTSETKRFLFTDSLNKDPEVWRKNDKIENYNKEIQKEVKLSLSKALSGAATGAAAGATIGSFIPVIGTTVGAMVGAALGFLGGLFEG